MAVPRGPGRFLNGIFGRDGDWLFVPAAVALIGILVARRREPRTDPLRGATVLWAAWLFLTWCFFASSHSINSYYLAAFAPAIAALCGMGLALAWHVRERPGVRAVVGGTVVAATAYGLYLLPSDAGVRPWIVASTLALALAAVAAVAVSLRPRPASWTVRAAVGLSAVALSAGTVWASATAVVAELGPFDSPYQPAALTAADHAANARSAANVAVLPRIAAKVAPTVSVITAETSAQSSVPDPRHRPRVPPGRWLHRTGTQPHAGPIRRRHRHGQDRGGAGHRRAADPEPRPALGHGALPAPARPRTTAPSATMRLYDCSAADAGATHGHS